MSTITKEQQEAIRAFVMAHHIPSGLGSKEEACSIASINLALNGRLSDEIPLCMSPVTGRWIISEQDAMPDTLRNSTEWKELLPFAAGTGRDHEGERLQLILDWVWGTVLPTVLPVAKKYSFEDKWQAMLSERTYVAARAAADAAWAARAAADAAWAAADAADAAARAAADADAADAAAAAAAAAAARAAADADAADAAAAAAAAASDATWTTFNPVGLLRRLIEVGQ